MLKPLSQGRELKLHIHYPKPAKYQKPLTQGRELKFVKNYLFYSTLRSPSRGARIEMRRNPLKKNLKQEAPHVGTRIEIERLHFQLIQY